MDCVNYWLMKSEPEVYSILSLQEQGKTVWDGVRNYQARNFLRQMHVGDLAFFYHSNTNLPSIVGLMRVKTINIVDPSQFEPTSKYYDPKSSRESPRWQTVEVEFVEIFPHPIALSTLREKFSDEQLLVVRKGNRLSVIPVAQEVAQKILDMVSNGIK